MKLLSRADLLRTWDVSPSQAHQAKLAYALGFAHKHQQTSPTLIEERNTTAPKVKSNKPTSHEHSKPGVAFQPEIAERYWYVKSIKPLPSETPIDAQSWPDLPTDTAVARAKEPEPEQPLLSTGQWQNLWDQVLPCPRKSTRIDVKRALKRIAQAKPLNTLPKAQHMRFNRKVILLWDYDASLYPAWDDMRRAWASLHQLLGKTELKTYFLSAGPNSAIKCAHTGEWFDALACNKQDLVLCIGAFGALHTGKVSADWSVFIKSVRKQVADLVLLALCPLQQAPVPVIPIDPMHRQGAESQATQLDHLLALLTRVWKPSYGMLRQLRRLLPQACLHTELLVHNHSDIQHSEASLSLGGAQMAGHQQSFKGLPKNLRDQTDELTTSWRSIQNALEWEASKLQRNKEQTPKAEDYPVLHTITWQVHQAFTEQTNHTIAFQQTNGLLALTENLVEVLQTDPQWQAFLQTASAVARELKKVQPVRQTGLPALDTTLALVPTQRQLMLVADLQHPRTLLTLSANAYQEQWRMTLSAGHQISGQSADIIDNGQQYHLQSISKPAWAERIWQDQDGLHAAHESGSVYRLIPANQETSEAYWQCIHNAWAWAEATGIDQYGLWAECRVEIEKMFGRNRTAAFRLRWIPAGSFMMGSPEEEKGREDNETQHAVTLTQGFWLGETTVTQALWQAVMGDNPAEFKSNLKNPVEQVSWEDCQNFIQKLQKSLLDLPLNLPTEAQWEYACRAGTDSAFNWGDDALNTDKANYRGEWDWGDEEKEGEYRATTLPAKYFKPNNWGLYQMHGNVWEWCADWQGSYPAEPALDLISDPVGPGQGQLRVLRGGSWSYRGRYLRSARRNAIHPGDRFDVGLRLAGGLDPQQASEALCADRRPVSSLDAAE